ncbi:MULTISPECIES: ABC transporter substrate-binding protein [Leptolyngbya]|uniref:ABC transporter substrate-binding protein n=1 Tax=Leptolyngbya TaxID=47251 RepID=UPI001683D7E8|nr:ABC transporter substrate-binding protein [Leptolyngbya sp. FACHB-1624]MBD1856718.1 ABC transporter substrate-binding protein [Leptolyngbya sp. FACHB-1624]
MSISIVLRFGPGNFEQDGFPVSLQVLENGKLIAQENDRTRIPAAPEIPSCYAAFLMPYTQLGETFSAIQLVEDQRTHVSPQAALDACRSAKYELETEVERWFEHPSFQKLQAQILFRTAQVPPDQTIPIIIDADTGNSEQNTQLRKLPWHVWKLFMELYNAEPVIGAKIDTRIEPLRSQITILAIFGSGEGGLELEEDQRILTQLQQLGARVEIVNQPSIEQLYKLLWDYTWDILFFAGHSGSANGCTSGYIQISDQQTIPISSLREALVYAVRGGLRLAIFNSCDGLGIASELIDLKIPSVVVMREPVPDLVARKFLKHFLNDFSQGRSLYRAVQTARRRLQAQEYDLRNPCPAASWLPIVCQSPNQPELVWLPDASLPPPQHKRHPELKKKRPELPLPPAHPLPWSRIALIGVALLFLATLGYCTQQKPPQAPTALVTVTDDDAPISRGEKPLSSDTTTQKQKGINAFKNGDFKKAKELFAASLATGEGRNDPETLIYKNNAIANLTNNRLRIAVSVPISGDARNIGAEILRGVAQVQDQINGDGKGQGINGAMLEIVVADDQNNPEIAKQVARRFVNDDSQVLAVIGHNASDASLAAAEIYKNKLVMITPTSWTERLSVKGNQNFIFRVVPTSRIMADRLADYAIQAGTPNVTVCFDSRSPDNAAFKEEFAAALESKGGRDIKPTLVCDFASQNLNPEVAIEQIRSSGATAIVLAPHVNNISEAIKLAKANRGPFKLKLLGSATLYTMQTLQEGGNDVNGLVLPAPWHPKAYPDFAKTAQELWGGPVGWRTAAGYDAAQVIRAGLGQGDKRAKLQQVLRNSKFEVTGAGEKVRFNPQTGERQLPSIRLVEVKPGAQSGTGFDFELQ